MVKFDGLNFDFPFERPSKTLWREATLWLLFPRALCCQIFKVSCYISQIYIYFAVKKNCFKVTKNTLTFFCFHLYNSNYTVGSLSMSVFSTNVLYLSAVWLVSVVFSFSFHSAEDFYEESDPAGSFGKMPFWRWCPAWSQHHVSEWNFNSIFTQLD